MRSDNHEYTDWMENWPQNYLKYFPQTFLHWRLDPVHVTADKQI